MENRRKIFGIGRRTVWLSCLLIGLFLLGLAGCAGGRKEDPKDGASGVLDGGSGENDGKETGGSEGSDGGKTGGSEEAGAAASPLELFGEDGKAGWHSRHLAFEKEYYATLVLEDCLYGTYWNGETLALERIALEDGSVLEQFELPEDGNVWLIEQDRDGRICLFGDRGERDCLWLIDSVGEEPREVEDFVLEDREELLDQRPKAMYQDEEGNYYLWYKAYFSELALYDKGKADALVEQDRVYIRDANFQPLFYKEFVDDREGFYFVGLLPAESGAPFMMARDGEGIYAQAFDVEAKGFGTPDRDVDRDLSQYSLYEPIEAVPGGFLYCEGTGIYEYRYEDRKSRKFLDINNLGLTADFVVSLDWNGYQLRMVDRMGYYGDMEYTEVETGEDLRQVVTVGTLFGNRDFSALSGYVRSFNRYNKTYRAEILQRPYNTEEAASAYDTKELEQQFILEILTEGGADVLDMSLSLEHKLADKGVLADLYDFMAREEDYGREDFVESILKAYEEDGHLYVIGPDFWLYTMVGSREVFGDRSGLTVEELRQVLEEKGRTIDAVAGLKVSDRSALSGLIAYSMDEFVDWEERTCSFETEEFLDALAFIKDYQGPTAINYLVGVSEGEVVMSTAIFHDVSDYQLQKEVYGGELSLVGYPCSQGSGTVATLGEELSINALGKNQEGAWEFIKYCLGEGLDLSTSSFPILQRSFDRKMELDMTPSFWTDSDGNQRESAKDAISNAYTQSYIVYHASKEEADIVRALVNNCMGRPESDNQIMAILDEEVVPYFEGQKSAEDVAAIIQNRVSLYLQE